MAMKNKYSVTQPEIILASKSTARRQILENAEVPFRWLDANIEETVIKEQALALAKSPEVIASDLAEAKAQFISKSHPNAFIIGCDQLLCLDDKIYDKPTNLKEAASHLYAFRGRIHKLVAAVVIVKAGELIWSHSAEAKMQVRHLSDEFIDTYLKIEGGKVLTSVGAYRLEGMGAQIFERIDGDYFTILGLPLLPLLEELRNQGILNR